MSGSKVRSGSMIENVLGEVTNTKRDKTETDNPQAARGEDIRKVKVALADALFDLKKAEEDFAEYKRTARAEREKQTRKLEESIARLRLELDCQFEDAGFRKAQNEKEHSLALTALKNQLEAAAKEQIAYVTTTFERQIEAKDKLHTRISQEAAYNSAQAIERIKTCAQKQMQELKSKYEEERKEYMMRSKLQIEEREKKLDSLIVGLQSEKKTEEKQHEKTRMEGAKEREKLLSDLCYERNLKIQAEYQVSQKEEQLNSLRRLIADKDKHTSHLTKKHQSDIEALNNKFSEEKERVLKQYGFQASSTIQQHLIELEKCEKRIQSLETKHEKKIQMMQKGFQEMSAKFVARPSKKEDSVEIIRLEQALTKKEDECNKLIRELKHCNLELQNKEDIYSRIFKGSNINRHEKKETPVPERSAREELFRKSHTADIKFLLKMYGGNQK